MIKCFFQLKNYHLSILFISFIFCLLISGCGKRRPPQPPTERIPQRAELGGFQRGNQVFLQWSIVPRNASDNSVLSLRRADVYRLAESPASPLSLTEEEFAAKSTLIGSVEIPKFLGGNQKIPINYTDKLDLTGGQTRLRYAVRYINANGQPAAFSNFLLITPISDVAAAPRLNLPQLTESAVILSWERPAANADGSTPLNLIGYNIYRQSGNDVAKIVNQTPVTETFFRDETFKFGEKYTYFVRAVSFGAEAVPVESLESESVSLTPKDNFAPKPPEGITVAAAPNRLALFFVANTEKDLAGYNIYRSPEESFPAEKRLKLNADLIKTTTFEDTNIESGKKYYYYITAVDLNGNESAPSEKVSEVAP